MQISTCNRDLFLQLEVYYTSIFHQQITFKITKTPFAPAIFTDLQPLCKQTNADIQYFYTFAIFLHSQNSVYLKKFLNVVWLKVQTFIFWIFIWCKLKSYFKFERVKNCELLLISIIFMRLIFVYLTILLIEST